MMYGNGWMWGHNWGWGGWLVMGVMVLFSLAVIVGVVATIRYLSAGNRPPVPRLRCARRDQIREMVLAERSSPRRDRRRRIPSPIGASAPSP